MKVRFYNFSKRKNSTAIPSSSYTELTVLLKNDTSVHDPVLQIAGGPNITYNYAYIPTFDRYYFVKDYVSVANGLTDYYLSEDVMGSHVSEISACSCRVAFCTNPYYSTLNDPRIAVHSTKETHTSYGSAILSSTGCYVLTVLNGINPGTGLGTTYIMTKACLQQVSKWFTEKYDDFIDLFFKGSPMDGVFSLVWVPFPFPSSAGTAPSEIYIGNRGMVADGYSIPTSSVRQLTDGLTNVVNTSLATNLRYAATDFRAVEPYTTGTMYLPGVGVVDVNQGDFLNGHIYIVCTQDYQTGDMVYTINNGTGVSPATENVLASYTCNVGAQCPLGQITTNANGAVSGLTTIAGGMVTGAFGLLTGNSLAALGGAGAAVAGASSMALSMNKRQASISGSIGGRSWSYVSIAGSLGIPQHTEVSVDTEDPEDSSGYIAIKGRPLGEVVTISSCSGYIECDGASVNISGSDLERDEINAIMNSGFYFE